MRTWTSEEVKILRENYNKVSNKKLEELLPEKSPQGIYKKAYKMGMRKSAEAEFRNRSEARKREKAANWNGGVSYTRNGYRMILYPEHHRADKRGYVMEHILVFERKTGVTVPSGCCVHHLNGDKTDNRIENLCMMSHSAHTVFHHIGVKLSERTKALISEKAKARFADKRNHPFYKDVDVAGMVEMRRSGAAVLDICKHYGITKTTYYSKIGEYKNGT